MEPIVAGSSTKLASNQQAELTSWQVELRRLRIRLIGFAATFNPLQLHPPKRQYNMLMLLWQRSSRSERSNYRFDSKFGLGEPLVCLIVLSGLIITSILSSMGRP